MGENRTGKEMRCGSGGFELPRIYRKDKKKLSRLLKQGQQDLVEMSRWSSADDFMHFVLEQRFLELADKTYPSPRRKTEVPVWFLICAQLVLRLYSQKAYNDLTTFLKAGTILSRVGYNVGKPIGFNGKNKRTRTIPCDQDTVRKFFKDSDPLEMRRWFCQDLQSWFLKQSAIDTEGIFIADQTHIVVPDNDNYQDAVRMPVDEHGQLYKGTKEQIKNYKWHPCYTLSALLNLKRDGRSFHYSGYEFGPGNEDEFPQATQMLERFVGTCGKGVIKLLILDRGYISADFVNLCKGSYQLDVLHPLKTNMSQYQDAIELAKQPETTWDMVSDIEEENMREKGEKFKISAACTIPDIDLWEKCKYPLFVTVVRTEKGDKWETEETDYFVLCSTRKFSTPSQVCRYYRLRARVEEGFRQIKHSWLLKAFPSPHRSLLEAHVGFILLTYSLLNLYLRRSGQENLVGKFLDTIRKEAMAQDENSDIVAYSKDVFGLFGLKEYTQLVCNLEESARTKLMENLNSVNQR